MKNFFYSMLLLLGFSAHACKEKSQSVKYLELQCSDSNTKLIAPHAWDFFVYKPGSWWVYEEENTRKRDSIWINNFENVYDNASEEKRACGCSKDSCIQKVNLSFASSRIKNQDLYKQDISTYLLDGFVNIRESSQVVKPLPDYRAEYRNFRYHKNIPFYGWGENYGIYEDLDSFVVNGKVYKDILHHHYNEQESIPDWRLETWYARNIYIIRYRRNDSTTWHLVKYNIVK